MTLYRTINDGYCEWLQYFATVESGWWIFKRKVQKWKYIRSDYYDYFDEQWENWEDKYGFSNRYRNYKRYINDRNIDLEWFVNKYPNIHVWICQQKKIVKKKREAAHYYHKQIELKKGEINYLNK